MRVISSCTRSQKEITTPPSMLLHAAYLYHSQSKWDV